MVSRYDPIRREIEHLSVNACLAPLCSVDGMAVTTVEGIGSTKESLHPCQVRLPLKQMQFEFMWYWHDRLHLSIIGTHSQGTRISVWFLHTGHGDVHVRSPEEQLHAFGRGAGGSV